MKQAKECKLRIQKELDKNPLNEKICYCSPLQRAQQTAKILEAAFSQNITTDDRLREQLIPKFANAASRDYHRKEAKTVGKYLYKYPGGESGQDVVVRLGFR